MRKRSSALGIIAATALCCAAPLSLHWSSANAPSLAVDTADARIGHPLTPGSVAGVNRRMLAWGKDDLRARAAARLITHEQEPAILRTAIAALRESGEECWSAVSVLDSHVTGWVAWTANDAIEAALLPPIADEGQLLGISFRIDAGCTQRLFKRF